MAAKKQIVFVLLLSIGFAASRSATADILLFNIDDNESAWNDQKAGLLDAGSWDLETLDDFGNNSTDGPVDSTGGGLILPGFLPDNVTLTTQSGFLSNIYTVGPSVSWWNNPFNGTTANHSWDEFQVDFDNPVIAFEFNAISDDTGGTVSIKVVDGLGATTTFSGQVAPETGNRYGVIATNGSTIRLVGVVGTYAGIQGAAASFASVPEPHNAVCVLLLIGILARRRP